MKFEDLKIGTKFASKKYPGKIFTKIKETPGSCCSKPCNATGIQNPQVHSPLPTTSSKKEVEILFSQDEEVNVV